MSIYVDAVFMRGICRLGIQPGINKGLFKEYAKHMPRVT